MQLNLSTDKQLKLALSAVAVVVACLVIYIQHGWINDDTVLYIEAARLLSAGDWQAATNLFPWPFYSLLISGLHWFTNLNYQLCAQLLNVIFFATSTYYFLHIITLAGGSRTTLISGALLLFSTPYIVGDILPMLLRDQGFWAFFLAALAAFIAFYRHQRWQDALLWQLFSIFAMLFRIEMAIYILFLPTLLLFLPNTSLKTKLQYFTQANMLNLALVLLGLFGLVMIGDFSIQRLGRAQEVIDGFSQLQASFNNELAKKAHRLSNDVLGEPLDDYAWFSLISTYIGIVILKSLSAVGWIPTIFAAGYYHKLKTLMANDARRILLATAILAIIIGILIILKVYLLSGRYVIVFGFAVLIFAAFGLADLYSKWRNSNIRKFEKLALVILGFTILIGIISNNFPKKAGYNYEQDAVAYLKKQQISNQSVFFVSPRARYYAGAAYNGRGYDYWDFTKKAIEDGSIKQHQYLMLNFDMNEDDSEQQKYIANMLPDYQIAEEFYGYKRKKKVTLYVKRQAAN